MSADSVAETQSGITTPLYKILVDGHSCHGGDMEWSLATLNEDGSYTPGEWMTLSADRSLELCEYAIHLTDQPAAWYVEGGQCWLAEYRGETVGELGGWESKVGVREARLLRPVAWADAGVWSEGDHTADNGVVRLYDNATATLYGSATATLSGNATATLYDNATATLYGSATATLYGNATARLYDNATARLYDNATAISDRWHNNSAQVSLSQMAVHVDRRGGNVVCRVAEATS